MATPNAARGAQRASNIVALLEHKPGPGIYSRLERAVQGLPENVRVQELPGLLKRYKDGIPGWELKAVDLDSVVAGRTTVPRDELLAAVRERSPVFTHQEVVLGGRPQQQERTFGADPWGRPVVATVDDLQKRPVGIGEGVSHGAPKYQDYGQGGDDYTEILLLQPQAPNVSYGNHWGLDRGKASEHVAAAAGQRAVAHARMDTHGDALRINELQSDLGIHNRKQREMQLEGMPDARAEGLPFPLEDAWSDLLTKRAVLEAARQGHRAIEVASPRSIADKVGGNIDNYEHFYGKVVPGSLERLGRKMGGLMDESASSLPSPESSSNSAKALDSFAREASDVTSAARYRIRRNAPNIGDTTAFSDGAYSRLVGDMRNLMALGKKPEEFDAALASQYGQLYRNLVGDLNHGNMPIGRAMKVAGEQMSGLIQQAKAEAVLRFAALKTKNQPQSTMPGRRYIISDEMRKNILTNGIPAAVAIGAGTGIATGGGEAEAKPILPTSDAALRAAMPWQTQRKIARLTKQVDAAYEKGDFKTAEKLDAQREQLVDDWDNKFEEMDEGDSSDFEPENYDADSAWTDELANIYGRVAGGSQAYAVGNDAELAGALRGVFPDTARANQISDQEIIQYAKDAFDQRQAHLAKVRSRSSEDGIRSMQARLRDAAISQGVAVPLAAGFQGGRDDAEVTAASVERLNNPFMAQARGVNENRELPAGSGGTTEDLIRGVTGDFDYSMAISPAEWEAHRQRQLAGGMSEDQRQFQQNVTEVMGRPIIRVGAAKSTGVSLVDGDDFDRITPAQFIGEYADMYAPRLDDEARGQLVERVAARLSGANRDPDYMADDIIDRMMGSLKESSPGGKFAKVDPMPRSQFEDLKQQYGDWAESMLTPGTAENFDSLRGYELLRTTLDGVHAPAYADSVSNAAALVGGVIDPSTLKDFEDATFYAGPEGRFRRANRDYQNSMAKADEPAAFRNEDGRSRFASTAMNNIQGLLRAGGDVSNTVGAISWPLYESFSEFGRTPVGKAVTGEGLPALWDPGARDDWNFMATKRDAFDREQTIRPDGMSLEEFNRQLDAHKQDRREGEAWGATTFPNVQQAFDTVTGSQTKKTWGPPLYNDYFPNFFQNTVGNIPSAAIAAGSAATGGILGGLAGLASPKAGFAKGAANVASGMARGIGRGAVSAAASQAGDTPFDFATDQVAGSVLGGGPQNYGSYILTPQQDNDLLPGVDPNSMSIEELNDARHNALYDRERRFQSNMRDWNRRPKSDAEQAYDQWRQAQ